MMLAKDIFDQLAAAQLILYVGRGRHGRGGFGKGLRGLLAQEAHLLLGWERTKFDTGQRTRLRFWNARRERVKDKPRR